MMFVVTIVLLAAGVAFPSQESFTLQPSTALEKLPNGASQFSCKGVTDLPDQSILSINFYYKRGAEEVAINYQRVQVKEGNFQVSFPHAGGDPFPGLYLFRVVFDPSDQYSVVRKQVPEVRERLQWETVLPIGTAEDVKTATQNIREEFVGGIRRLSAIQQEVSSSLESAVAKKETKGDWEKGCVRWQEEIHTLAEKYIGRKEHRFSGLPPAAETFLDSLSHMLFDYMNECGALLNRPVGGPANRARLNTIARRFEQGQRILLKTIGAAVPTDEDPRVLTARLFDLYNSLDEWYKAFRSGSLDNPSAAWGEWKEGWLLSFTETVQSLSESAGDGAAEQIFTISEAASAALSAVGSAVKEGKGDNEPDQHLEMLMKKLQGFAERIGYERK